MDITPLVPEGRQIIESYGDDGFRISGERYPGSVIVWPEGVVPWAISAIEAAVIETLHAVFSTEPPIEILLIGSGATFEMAPAALRSALGTRGVSVESMDTGAACRTYNVLMAEDRRVAAALIPAREG
ncbi:MAG: Mth938-like domain-containing protein [Rhodospirillales bacterium]|nr:Mth938-like domain-containing protein [Rhodospirillales bacterium]